MRGDPTRSIAGSVVLRAEHAVPIEAYLHDEEPSATWIGGKGARLVWLARHGFPIPRTWILDARLFLRMVQRHLPRACDPASLLSGVGTREGLERIAHARDIILRTPLDSMLRESLRELWHRAEPHCPWGMAVRSSATTEDVQLTAMAGLASSVLGVRGGDELEHAVRQVWASALLPRALGHLASRGISDLSMAVVVQSMVRAEVSGVMFTRPPPGTDERVWGRDERLVNATLGLGAPVVNGAVSPDMIRFSARGGVVRDATIAYKPRALVIGAAGPEFVDVGEEKARSPAISEVALQGLAQIASRLERVEDAAHDVEFAVEAGRVILVQARPVVGTGFPEGGGEDTVWSRANVGEALPGVATPLTWSVARGFSERGFRQAFGSLGCSVPRDVVLVANVHGRFYLNTTQFMRIAAQVPGLDPRTLVSLGGGDGVEVLERQVRGVSKVRFLARMPATAARLLFEQARLSDRVARHDRLAWRRYRERRELDLRRASHRAVERMLREAIAELDSTGTLMLACASASLAAHVGLKILLSLVAPGDADALARSLTAGVSDLDSARPGIAIARIASIARQQPELAEQLADGRFDRIEQICPGAVRNALERFLADFGDRAVREAELATPRWTEDHQSVLALVAASLRDVDPERAHAPERAKAQAAQQLAALASMISPFEMRLVRGMVHHAQRTTRLRERMRAWVTRTLGSIRYLAMEVDRRLLARHPDLGPGAVFFCTMDELLQALHDDVWDGLPHLVRMRRAEHARDEQRPDPPVTFVGRPPPVVLPPASSFQLRGLPASGGVVEGRVRLLRAGHELQDGIAPGEVLVARTTDVGLTPLFLLAGAVVTELGGPLSHAAIVAREYGVPAVVNVAGATVALHTGDRVRVDGNRGIVERLSSGQE